MIIYNAIFGVLAFLRLGLDRYPLLRDQVYPFVLAALFLFSAFRYQVGCDWFGYYHQFDLQGQFGRNFALAQAEPVWWLIMQIMHEFGLPYHWLNVVSSMMFFAGIHVLARRQPDPLAFLVLLFPVLIVQMPMSGIRQGAAIGLICIAMTSFLDGRVVRYVILVVLAATIHSSALALLLFVPLIGGQYTTSRVILAVLLAIPGAFLISMTEAAHAAETRYIESGMEAGGAVYRVGLLALTGLMFFLILAPNWQREFPRDYRLASIGSLLMLLLFPVIAVSTVIADRFGYYVVPVQAMIFARIPYLQLRASSSLYMAAPYLALGALLLVWTSLSWHFMSCYVPYQTWLFGVPLPEGVVL